MRLRKEHYHRKMPHYQQPGQWYSVTIILKGAMPKGTMDKYSLKLQTARNKFHYLQKELEDWDTDFPRSTTENSDIKESAQKISDLGKSESRLAESKKEYQIALRKYRLAYDKILNKSTLPGINLMKEENRKIIEEALLFWEGKKITNHAWCIMSNHIHWIFTVLEKEVIGVSNSNNKILDFGKSKFGESARIFWVPKSDTEKPVYLQDILHSVKLFTARRINENENCSGQLWEHESFDTTIRNDRHFVNVFNYVIQNPVSAQLVSRWEDWPGTRTFQSP